jgi:photosystem II stability/assembly factor-like uncharacterized protein
MRISKRTVSAPLLFAFAFGVLGGCGDGSPAGTQDPMVVPPIPQTQTAPASNPPSSTKPTVAAPYKPNATELRAETWTRTLIGEMPPSWFIRDGAQMVTLATGRILFIGGWNHYDVFGPNYVPDEGGGDRTTNEVWKSDDEGKTWQLLLPHDPNAPKTGPGARFPPAHAIGVNVYKGHAVVMGNDASHELEQVGDVWHESDNGMTWTRVTQDAPVSVPLLFMLGKLGDDLYVMGGQSTVQNTAAGLNNVFRSHDGGITWEQLPDAPWKPRGMVYRPVEDHGKLVIVGGGLYSGAQGYLDENGDIIGPDLAFNGVYAFDGKTWTTVLPDGHSVFEQSFYNSIVALNGRIWMFNGYDPAITDNIDRALYSEDGGYTWQRFALGAGGVASHADATVVVNGKILRVSGNMDADERGIWEFKP